MEQRHRIVIVDDHALIRAVLRRLLDKDPGIEVVGEAGNGRLAISAVDLLAPHLVLMDLTMPEMNGVEATLEIKRCHPEVRVLVLTMHKSEDHVRASLEAGADGYILKDAGPEALLDAIHSVLQGKTYLGTNVSAKSVTG